MSSPFDGPGGTQASHLVPTAGAGDLSLWPVFAETPGGWWSVTSALSHAAARAEVARTAARPPGGTD